MRLSFLVTATALAASGAPAQVPPFHGFAVSRDLRARSGGVVELKDAALYQALHRMERQRLVEGEWGLSEKGKRAKFYRLTRKGEKRLESSASEWNRWAEAVGRILGSVGEGT